MKFTVANCQICICKKPRFIGIFRN